MLDISSYLFPSSTEVYNPLMRAYGKGDQEAVKAQVLEEGIDIAKPDGLGFTPIDYAIFDTSRLGAGSLPVVFGQEAKFAPTLQNICDSNLQKVLSKLPKETKEFYTNLTVEMLEDKDSPLAEAFHKKIVEELIAPKPEKPWLFSPNVGPKTVHLVAYLSSAEVLDYILKKYPNLMHFTDGQLNTLAHYASFNPDQHNLAMLANHGAKLLAKNSKGYHALHNLIALRQVHNPYVPQTYESFIFFLNIGLPALDSLCRVSTGRSMLNLLFGSQVYTASMILELVSKFYTLTCYGRLAAQNLEAGFNKRAVSLATVLAYLSMVAIKQTASPIGMILGAYHVYGMGRDLLKTLYYAPHFASTKPLSTLYKITVKTSNAAHAFNSFYNAAEQVWGYTKTLIKAAPILLKFDDLEEKIAKDCAQYSPYVMDHTQAARDSYRRYLRCVSESFESFFKDQLKTDLGLNSVYKQRIKPALQKMAQVCTSKVGEEATSECQDYQAFQYFAKEKVIFRNYWYDLYSTKDRILALGSVVDDLQASPSSKLEAAMTVLQAPRFDLCAEGLTDIKKAKRGLALKFHPDKSSEDARYMELINSAFSYLKNLRKSSCADSQGSDFDWGLPDDEVQPSVDAVDLINKLVAASNDSDD